MSKRGRLIERDERSSRPIRAVLRCVERALRDTLGLGGGQTLMVGLSGGCDSAALLFCLADLQHRSGWHPRALHVDHGIASAAVRAGFRAAAAEAARIAAAPFEIRAVNAPAELLRGGGLEAAARRVRYTALADGARAHGAAVVATAHTRRDQAETVLMRIVRGTGVDGLAGIPALAPLPESSGELQAVRPLLDLSREQTQAVCRAWRFEPVEDPANADRSYVRSRVRAELLPLLRRINPQVEAALARLADQSRDERLVLQQAAAAAADHLTETELGWPRAELLALAPPIQRRVLRLLAARRGLELTAERSDAALALIERGRGRIELGSGWLWETHRGAVRLRRSAGG